MTDVVSSAAERRLLVLAPVGRDAALIVSLLAKSSVQCAPCRDLDHLLSELQRGAAALLIAEEALAQQGDRLTQAIVAQPSWSDIPVLILTLPGAESAVVARAVEILGNVTLLERPVRTRALASTVRTALRARERQYHTRAHLVEREEADRRKDEFIATLAHELRNPLAPIRTSLDVMRLSSPTGACSAVSEIMDRQVNQLVRLVDDLIDVSRITRGKIELRKDAVNLESAIEAAVETSRPLIEASRHELHVAFPVEPLIVDADPMRLAQVFSNLLNNAARYTDPGGRISIEARRDMHTAVVAITDSGIGIASEALARVFDLFTQANAGDSRSQRGLGIGLTVARSLVEMHGGSIAARSQGVGCGSQFVVRLPVCAALRAANAPPSSNCNIVRPQRVLVVDDNRDAADTLGALLGILGTEVKVVYDGSTALRTMDAFRPAVVVLDLGMPGMDGYEVARCIRQRADSRRTTLVALTGWGQDRDRELTRSAGFDHHLIKPVDIRALQSVLASVDA